MDETPSSYLFADLRTFGGITNKEAALELLTNGTNYGSGTPRDRITDRTFLSRQIVHVAPTQVHREFYADFIQSAQTITGKIASNLGSTQAQEAIIAHYSGSASDTMASLLTHYALDGNLYRNTVQLVVAAPFPSSNDKAVLLVMLFLICGCLADPSIAVKTARTFIEQKLAFTFTTPEPKSVYASIETGTPPPENLGLIRIDNGMACSSLYPLSAENEGTLIGSLATGKNGINDVGMDVSRSHLRIFIRDGAWFAQDLGSTNGSQLISGADKSTTAIGSKDNDRTTPVKIEHGDVLHLGATTQFLVLRIAETA